MTTRADPPKNAISYAEFIRRQAEAGGPGMTCICAPIVGEPSPGIIDRIAVVLFPWLSGPAEPEREAEL